MKSASTRLLAWTLALAAANASGATFTVTTSADGGPGSLRQALLDANAVPGRDTVEFRIGTGPQTIAVLWPLPTVTDPVVIDGTTQPGFAGAPIVELSGGYAVFDEVHGLVFVANDCLVRGLAVNLFPGVGLALLGNSNRVEGNYVGVALGGWSVAGNEWWGVHVAGADNVVGGLTTAQRNVLGGNAGAGVYLVGTNATRNRVQGNLIGLAADSSGAVGNETQGVVLNNAPDNLIGGTASGAGNVICGNWRWGLIVYGAAAAGNRVEGNVIGLSADGRASGFGNGWGGLLVNDAPRNLIGGVEAGVRNVISGNQGEGVLIGGANATDNAVQGNFIGTDLAGSSAGFGNAGAGVAVYSDSNLVGGTNAAAGNTISANQDFGVVVANAARSNRIEGNFIGLDAAGQSAGLGNALGNARGGVLVDAGSANVIGGSQAGARNVISGNGGPGLVIQGASANRNVVLGNFIGTDVDGEEFRLGNAGAGVLVRSSANIIGAAPFAARNVISANQGFGLVLEGTNAVGNQVRGNFIGTDPLGVYDLGNYGGGVLISDGAANTLGGVAAEFRNLISGNYGPGLVISGILAQGNFVQGNLIGAYLGDNAFFGNFGDGIILTNEAYSNTIGGPAPGAGNRIALNQGRGVVVFGGGGGSGFRNWIVGNAIIANASLGIDLGADGVTPNDPGDADAGANSLLNFPVLTSAVSSSGATTITGIYSGRGGTFTIEFFANSACNPSGFGEGEQRLGTKLVSADVEGNGPFVVTFLMSVPPGQFITATASDGDGNTSEFSPCQVVEAGNTLPVLLIDDVALPEGSNATRLAVFTVKLSQASDQPVTVSFTTADYTARAANGDYSPTNGVLTFLPGETAHLIEVPIHGDLTAEEDETFEVRLSDPVNATTFDLPGVGTIEDDDAPLREINVAANGLRSECPDPFGTDRGWGGGTDPWELVDGLRDYPEWHHGLAFTGGIGRWIELAGPRQAVISLCAPQRFHKVILWHHGDDHVPAETYLDYWDGTNWVAVSFQRSYDLGYVPVGGCGAKPDTYTFCPVTGSALRYRFDNRFLNIIGTQITHGWLTEFEVWGELPPSLTVARAGHQVSISWPARFAGYSLMATTNLAPTAVWHSVGDVPVVVDGSKVVTLQGSDLQGFFRLIKLDGPCGYP